MAPKLHKLEKETTGLKLFPILTLLGWLSVGFSILIGVLFLAPTAAAYWGGNAKSVRDAAEVASLLLGQLATLAWWPKLLLPLTFLGVASFMVGIAMQFAAIPKMLERRTYLLARAVPKMGQK